MLRIANRAKAPPNHRFTRSKGHPFWTFSYLIQGSIRHFSHSGVSIINGPTFALRQPNHPYSLEIADPNVPCEEIYAIFTPPEHWQQWLDWPYDEGGRAEIVIPEVQVRQEIEQILDTGLRDWKSFHLHRNNLFMNALERVLILLDPFNPRHEFLGTDPRIKRVLEYMRRHFSRKLQVEELAGIAGLSTSRFAELFRKQLHVTPMQQLELYRLEQAFHKLFTENLTVEEIAFAVGFESASHFSTRFRKRYNRSPRQMREFSPSPHLSPQPASHNPTTRNPQPA